MDTQPVLTASGGVRLRPLCETDVPAIVEQSRDPVTVRYTTVSMRYGPGHARAYIADAAETWQRGRGAAYAVEFERRFAGLVNVGVDGREAVIGYATHPYWRGRGLATAAVTELLRWVFGRGVRRVHWYAMCGNDASLRVAYRCGFVTTGMARKEQRSGDVLCWAAEATPESFARRAAAPASPVSAVDPGTVPVLPEAIR
jgi:RimJ/RimL family protein N-acetyltransferase